MDHTEIALQRGAHSPLYAPEAARLARSGKEPRAIHSNCSGKHAGMLAVCKHEGHATGGYRDPSHPLQRRILVLLAEVCDLHEDEVLMAGDNCGVPAFALPLKSLARGIARIATGEGLSDELAGAALRIGRAMRAHPFLVAGTGRFDTEVMGATDLVSKSGAEAVLAVGSPGGWGMALKVSDGAQRAVRPAALAALASRGVEVSLDDPGVLGLHGEVVVRIEPLLGAG